MQNIPIHNESGEVVDVVPRSEHHKLILNTIDEVYPNLLENSPILLLAMKELLRSIEKRSNETLPNGCKRGIEGFELIRNYQHAKMVVADIERAL